MSLAPDFFQYLILLVLYFAGIYLVGHFILSLFIDKNNQEYKLFIKLILGLTSSTLLFALIKSHGNSQLVFLIFIFLIYLLFEKPQIANKNQFLENIKEIEFKTIISLLISLLVFFSIQYNKYFDIHNNLHALWTDPLFYARVGENMKMTGIETTSLVRPEFAQFYSPVFGHYFEAWTSGLISSIFHISGQNSMMLVYFPTTFTIVYSGTISLINVYNNKIPGLLIYFIAFLLIIIAPIRTLTVPFTDLLGGIATKYNLIYDTTQKLSIIYVFVIWFFILLKNNVVSYFYPLLALGIIYPITLAGIYAVLCVYFILIYFFTKNSIYNRYLIVTFLLIIFFICFYILNNIGQVTYNNLSLKEIIIEKISEIDFITNQFKRNISVISIYIIAFLVYTPLLVSFIITKKKINKSKMLLLFLMIIIPLLGSNLIYYIWDSEQLFLNIFIPLISITVLLLLIKIYDSNKYVFYLFASFIFIINSIQTIKRSDFVHSNYIIDTNEYNQIVDEFKEAKFINIAMLTDDSYMYNKNPIWVLYRISNNIYCENINSFSLRDINNIEKYTYYKNLFNTSFYKYVISNGLIDSIEIAQYKYIRETNIDYLLTSSSIQLSPNIKSLILKKYYFKTHNMYLYKLK